MLLAEAADAETIVVGEDGDDVQVWLRELRVHVVVHPADLGSALDRFAAIRSAHHRRERVGDAAYVVVRDEPAASPHPDVEILVPGGAPSRFRFVPPAWRDVDDAIAWISDRAVEVPLRSVAPRDFVTRLAASGALRDGARHYVRDLPALYASLGIATLPEPAPVPPRDDLAPPPMTPGEAAAAERRAAAEIHDRLLARHAGPLSAAELAAAHQRLAEARRAQGKPPLPSRIPVVGRNDPCPCGSGLKYKKCHAR
jgi:hypothetical protein